MRSMKALLIWIVAVGLVLSLFDLWVDVQRGWQASAPVENEAVEPAFPSGSEAQPAQPRDLPVLTF